MFQLKVLSREVTEQVLKMPEVIDTVKEVYRLKAEGETTVFPLVFHEFEPEVADMDIKSGWLKGSDIFGLKVVSWFGENTKMITINNPNNPTGSWIPINIMKETIEIAKA